MSCYWFYNNKYICSSSRLKIQDCIFLELFCDRITLGSMRHSQSLFTLYCPFPMSICIWAYHAIVGGKRWCIIMMLLLARQKSADIPFKHYTVAHSITIWIKLSIVNSQVLNPINVPYRTICSRWFLIIKRCRWNLRKIKNSCYTRVSQYCDG